MVAEKKMLETSLMRSSVGVAMTRKGIINYRHCISRWVSYKAEMCGGISQAKETIAAVTKLHASRSQ
jgi:hypothetical protein